VGVGKEDLGAFLLESSDRWSQINRTVDSVPARVL
jgi:hypothetical protein